jgi:hypothetical protein
VIQDRGEVVLGEPARDRRWPSASSTHVSSRARAAPTPNIEPAGWLYLLALIRGGSSGRESCVSAVHGTLALQSGCQLLRSAALRSR